MMNKYLQCEGMSPLAQLQATLSASIKKIDGKATYGDLFDDIKTIGRLTKKYDLYIGYHYEKVATSFYMQDDIHELRAALLDMLYQVDEIIDHMN